MALGPPASALYRCSALPMARQAQLLFNRWARGVMVSHPLRMRKALGSNPSVSTLCFICQARQGSPRNCVLASRLPFLVRAHSHNHSIWQSDVIHIVAQTFATTILKCRVWMDPILKTIWPSSLRRWLKAPFRKGVGSTRQVSFFLV